MVRLLLHGALRRLNRLAEAGVALAGGLVCSQLSTFMHHYIQNLSGRLDEAQRDVQGIVARAFQADLPVYAYLREFRLASNPIFVREGEALQAKIDRAAELADAHHALLRAGPLEKPFVFLTHLDPAIAADTWRHFEPAVPLDTVSLTYAGMAMLLSLLGWELGARSLRLVRRRGRRSPPGQVGTKFPKAAPGSREP